MHFYIYDGSLVDQRFAGVLTDVETNLTDLGLQGRVTRLGPLKSVTDAVHGGIKGGAKTIIAVGSDRTMAEVVNAVGTADVVIGYIPLTKPNDIAKLLGIPDGREAVSVLAARKTEVVDLGKANGYYFLTNVRAGSGGDVTLRCDGQFDLQPLEEGSEIRISNLVPGTSCQDGYLEATVMAEHGGWWRKSKHLSRVPVRRAELSSAGVATAIVENYYTVKLPLTIEILPRALKIIVGRDRSF